MSKKKNLTPQQELAEVLFWLFALVMSVFVGYKANAMLDSIHLGAVFAIATLIAIVLTSYLVIANTQGPTLDEKNEKEEEK